MDNEILDVLLYMRDTYGEDVFYNFSKSRNLLNDLCPKLTQERIQAKNLIELNGYFILKYAGNAYPIVRNKLIATYMSTYRVDEQAAAWIIDIFGALLGRGAAPKGKTQENIPGVPILRDGVIYGDGVAASQLLEKYNRQAAGRPSHILVTPRGSFTVPASASNMRIAAALPHTRGLIAADYHTVALCEDGTVLATGHNNCGQCNVKSWRDIVSVAAGSFYTVGLRLNGTVVAVGQNDYGQCEVDGWRDIVAISAGYRHTLGLRADGSVVAAGENRYGECSVDGWRNITTIIAGNQCTYAIKKDKRVLARGNSKNGEYDVSKLSDIIGIANASPYGALALKSDGTVQKAWRGMKGDFRKIKDLIAIAATPDCFIGLKKDGTVKILAYYWESSGVECGTDDWSDIIAIAAGRYHIVGLRLDGTLEAAMLHTHQTLNKGQCEVGNWRLRSD